MTAPEGIEVRSKARIPRRRSSVFVCPEKNQVPAPLLIVPVGLSYSVLSFRGERTAMSAPEMLDAKREKSDAAAAGMKTVRSVTMQFPGVLESRLNDRELGNQRSAHRI